MSLIFQISTLPQIHLSYQFPVNWLGEKAKTNECWKTAFATGEGSAELLDSGIEMLSTYKIWVIPINSVMLKSFPSLREMFSEVISPLHCFGDQSGKDSAA